MIKKRNLWFPFSAAASLRSLICDSLSQQLSAVSTGEESCPSTPGIRSSFGNNVEELSTEQSGDDNATPRSHDNSVDNDGGDVDDDDYDDEYDIEKDGAAYYDDCDDDDV